MNISSDDIPQADDINLVIAVVIAVYNGAITFTDIADRIGKYDDRQGRYYRLAAQKLGFIVNHNNQSELTELGREFVEANVEIRRELLTRQIFSSNFFQALIPLFELYSNGVSRQELINYIASIASLAESTATRRVSSVLNWLRNIDVIQEVDGKIMLMLSQLPIVEYQNDAQPLVPTTLDFNEYEIVQQRLLSAHDAMKIIIDGAKRERANKAHSDILNLLALRIQQAGGMPKYNRYVDLATKFNQNSYLFEAKSITESNVRSQLRRGLSQLYEYRYLQNIPQAKLVLAIERELPFKVQWMQDYLEYDRDISLIWDGDNELFASEKTRNELAFLWNV